MFYSAIIISLLSLGGLVTGGKECRDLYPKEVFLKWAGIPIPNAEQLRWVCPKLLPYLECVFENLPCEVPPTGRRYVTGILDMVTDICEDDSSLQKGYLASFDCFRNLEDKGEACMNTSKVMYESYRNFRLFAMDVDKDVDPTEALDPSCLLQSYTVACMSADILNTCGEVQHVTFVQLLRRLHIVPAFCMSRNATDAQLIKSQYLDFLAIQKDHPQMELYRQVFDLRRRRK